MSCQIGLFCSEKLAFSGDKRKLVNPDNNMMDSGSFGVVVPANESKMALISKSFNLDYQANQVRLLIMQRAERHDLIFPHELGKAF